MVLLVEGWGFWNYLRDRRAGPVEPELPKDRTWERRTLLSGGTVLILMGFVFGAWYAGANLYEHENREIVILKDLLDQPAGAGGLADSVNAYGRLQAEKAVQIAAHSHIIEFGLLAILLSFVQPYVFLTERWKRIWVKVLLAGSVILPVFVLLELKLGLLAGGIADVGGLMVSCGAGGDAGGRGPPHRKSRCRSEGRAVSRSRKLLILGGTVLAVLGMLYGLHYAVFVEHQTLDRMGGSLAGAFAHAAERRGDDSQLALTAYRETKYDYVRQVDLHSHWIGLAMLMIVLGVVFDEVAFG